MYDTKIYGAHILSNHLYRRKNKNQLLSHSLLLEVNSSGSILHIHSIVLVKFFANTLIFPVAYFWRSLSLVHN